MNQNQNRNHMNFLELAKNRYTTKVYDPAKRISEEKIEELKQIMRLSPSSINSQPWKFFFISDENMKNKLAAVSYFNEQKIKDASHLVVFTVIDHLPAFEAQIKSHLPEGSVAYYNQFKKPKAENELKSWLSNQVYISLGFFLSACASMDIDATAMGGLQPEAYDSILEISGYKTLFAVAIGYRNPNDFNQPSKNSKLRLDIDRIIVSI